MDTKKNYINGEWVNGLTTKRNINPSDTSDIIGEYANASVDQVNDAVAAAVKVSGKWAFSTPQQRFDILDFIGSEIIVRKEELGRLLAREEGKSMPESIGEVNRAAHIFKFFAGEALRIEGDKQDSVRPNIEIEVIRQPIGVVGLITPWNFPIAIPAWKIAPALAYGNCVIFKPADLTPGCAWALAEIISRSGIPAGVFNLLIGPGSEVGNAIVRHPDIAGISFTGSIGIGRKIAVECVSRMAKVQLEMGGKNPFVVVDDADIDLAVECAINSAFYSAGQRCTASSRIIVTEKIHDLFVEKMITRLKSLKIGDATDTNIHIGPLASNSQLEKSIEYLKVGVDEGATLAFGGEEVNTGTKGYFLRPALLTNTNNNMRVNREEIFGPVATVIRVKDYTEALEVANDTEFGLSSGIATTSLKTASHFKKHAKAGLVMVNLPTAGVDYHVPFGGSRGSSYGSREQGRYAAEFYTTVKTIYINP